MHEHDRRGDASGDHASTSISRTTGKPGGRALTDRLPPSTPRTDEERAAAALSRAEETIRKLDQLADQLATAIGVRDFLRARLARSSIDTFRRGLAWNLEEATQRGADPQAVAYLEQRAAPIAARLDTLLPRAPQPAGPVLDLLGNEDEAARAAWLGQLDDNGAAAPSSVIDAAARAGLGDVSGARIHTDATANGTADAIGARAVTVGRDVHFAAGEYQPDTADGAALLGHELAHVAQQSGSNAIGMAAKLRTSNPDDDAEHEADDAGATFAAALRGAQVAPISLHATPATIAPKRRGRTPGGMNAAMKVTAYDQGGKPIETWQSRAHWEGALPVHYEGTASGGRWSWSNSGATSVMVNTDERGGGGRPVQAWATSKKAARVVIHVAALDDVTELDALDLADLRDPKARGRFVQGSDAVGNALPEERAGDGSTVKVNPDATADAKRTRARRDGSDGTHGNDDQTTDGTGPQTDDGTHAPAATDADADTATDAQRDDGANATTDDDDDDQALDEADEADADTFDQALDDEIAQLFADLGEEGDGDGDGDGNLPGGSPDGRSGNDTRPDGHGKGGRGAVYDGAENKSPDANRNGADVADETVGGEVNPNAATAGRPGGEEGGSKGGVLGGSGIGLFGFTIAIPESLVGAVEIALIISDGNIAGFGVGTVRKAIQEATERGLKRGLKKGGAAATRRALKRQASEATADRVRALRKEIATALTTPEQQLTRRQRQLRKQWGKLSRADKARALRVTTWEMQRRFFDETLKAARKEAKALRRGIRRSKDLSKRADLAHKLAAVDELADAASVKPIAGRLPIGHKYAGQDFPKDKLPRDYQSQGLHIDADGFPEFEPYAMTLPNGKKSVHIEYTGRRDADFDAANAAAGLKRTPDGYVWHHHQRLGEMILIPRDLHDAVKHTGGVAVHKHATGVETYD